MELTPKSGQGFRLLALSDRNTARTALDSRSWVSNAAGARGHGQRVAEPRVGNLADDHDRFQLTDAMDPNLSVSGRDVPR